MGGCVLALKTEEEHVLRNAASLPKLEKAADSAKLFSGNATLLTSSL